MNRLPTTDRGRRPLINDIQPDLHPLDILHDAKKFLTVSYVRTPSLTCLLTTDIVGGMQQQPISAAFERITQAASLYDAWSETQINAVTDADQWAQHATQGVAWSMMGE